MSDVATTDLYEVTMAMPYLREDMRDPATFSLVVRAPTRPGYVLNQSLLGAHTDRARASAGSTGPSRGPMAPGRPTAPKTSMETATAFPPRHSREEARAMPAPAPLKKNEQAVPTTGMEATGASMRARVGDEIVVRGTAAGVVAHDGEIVGLQHADGSPPYGVRWADSGRVPLYLPGPDACIRHLVIGDGHVRAR